MGCLKRLKSIFKENARSKSVGIEKVLVVAIEAWDLHQGHLTVEEYQIAHCLSGKKLSMESDAATDSTNVQEGKKEATKKITKSGKDLTKAGKDIQDKAATQKRVTAAAST